jgi:hypothetical protein
MPAVEMSRAWRQPTAARTEPKRYPHRIRRNHTYQRMGQWRRVATSFNDRLEGTRAAVATRMVFLDAPDRRTTIRTMSTTRPKKTSTQKAAPPPSKRPDLARGLPGTDRERAEQRRRFAEEHRETLRRLGK